MTNMANPCCCMSLKRGAMVIGILDIALGALGIVFAIFAIESTDSMHKGNINTTETMDNSTSGGSTGEVNVHSPEVSWIYLILSLFIIYCALQIAFGSVLILGINKEKLLLLKGWMVFKATGIIFSIATLVAFILLGENATFKPNIFDAFSSLFNVYCMWVVYTLLHDIKKQNATPVKPFRA